MKQVLLPFVFCLQVEALHPENAKTHWHAEKHRRLVIMEEDDEADGCSWCPVIDESDRDEGKKVAQEYIDEGEKLQQDEDWDKALDAYNRGAVADPSSARCWLGLARVSSAGVCCVSCHVFLRRTRVCLSVIIIYRC